MNFIRKITILVLFCICIAFTKNIYAKYNYMISMDAFSLNRDASEILYTIEKSNNTDGYTNEDIILKIISNKEIETLEGFEIDDTRKILTRKITENESKNVILKDLSGNKKEVNYSIDNIDKEPPKIIGIEDGITYSEIKTLDYTDNIGIKGVEVEKYSNNLTFNCYTDYYDAAFYKGIDILGNQVYVDVINRPKGTKYYKFYLNNQLKDTTEKSEYTYTGLSNATTYTILVEAINEKGEVLDRISKSIKTKLFKEISTKKEGNNFYLTIKGIDSRVNIGYCYLWKQGSDIQKSLNIQMNSDRSVTYSFNALDIDGVKGSGYYYFNLQLFNNSNSNLNEIVAINVVFDGVTFQKVDDDNLDPYNLSQNGNYEIRVTDLAGNVTKKNCIIKR